MSNVHDFSLKGIDGATRSLRDYDGKALLIVNVASKCGLTPQYSGLESLYQKYSAQGLVVLGFPCNQFAGQEPGTDQEISGFCSLNYNVTFPLFSKVNVNGSDRAALYEYLTTQAAEPKGPGDVRWNFEKFVVSRGGDVLARFDPKVAPDDEALVKSIESALG